MSGAIPWNKLQKQFEGDSVYQDDLSKLMVSPEKVMYSKSTIQFYGNRQNTLSTA